MMALSGGISIFSEHYHFDVCVHTDDYDCAFGKCDGALPIIHLKFKDKHYNPIIVRDAPHRETIPTVTIPYKDRASEFLEFCTLRDLDS